MFNTKWTILGTLNSLYYINQTAILVFSFTNICLLIFLLFLVLFSNPPRTDYIHHHQQIHPLAIQQHNHPQFGASTSRNAALVASAEAAPQNECVTAWEPLQLRQEWTVSFSSIIVSLGKGSFLLVIVVAENSADHD